MSDYRGLSARTGWSSIPPSGVKRRISQQQTIRLVKKGDELSGTTSMTTRIGGEVFVALPSTESTVA